ncbi:MAG: MerR family transcriptional regulator [Anaerolineae bacterium]|nr:MerR family transcriptional regulator [Anaerolineae bacterium]
MDTELTIDQLAERAGVPVRTVRYYIAEGILPPAGARGKNATYGEEHLTKLLLARLLADRRVLLADIRDQVSQLTLEEARELLRREEAHDDVVRSAKPQSARDFVSALLDQAQQRPTVQRSARVAQPDADQYAGYAPLPAAPSPANTSWRRLELAPGVELHVRSDAEVDEASLIRRILRLTRRR